MISEKLTRKRILILNFEMFPITYIFMPIYRTFILNNFNILISGIYNTNDMNN